MENIQLFKGEFFFNCYIFIMYNIFFKMLTDLANIDHGIK